MTPQQPTTLFEPYAGSLDHPGNGEVAGQAGSLRKAILDSVIHELRTPLTSIKASVTMLLTLPRMKSCERFELLTIIDEATDQLSLLAGEAAEKARLDTGARLNLEPRSIEEIIDAARKDRRALFGTHSIQVQVPLELPAVRADLELIKKAPTQLLENASKYSPAEEPITVSVEVNGDFVMTSVIDRAVTVAARSEEGWGLAFNALQHFLTTHVGLSNTTIVE